MLANSQPLSQRHTFDPDALLRLHQLFHALGGSPCDIPLDTYRASSLRRMIASRIVREAGRGEVDEQVLRRMALFGIAAIGALAPLPSEWLVAGAFMRLHGCLRPLARADLWGCLKKEASQEVTPEAPFRQSKPACEEFDSPI
jgi:hypothetical protein